MASGSNPVIVTLCMLYLLIVTLPFSSSSSESPTLLSLVVGQNATLKFSEVPGVKPRKSVRFRRVHLRGLSRLDNWKRFADTVRVKIAMDAGGERVRPFRVCFHRDPSLGVGMCPLGQWEKVVKGSWSGFMSPYEHKLIDIRIAGSSLDSFDVSLEEEFHISRVIFFVSGVILMSLAPSISNSLVFYYGSGIAIGPILVIFIVLLQEMKLLPARRKNSIFMLYSVIGLGSFLLGYIPGLIRLLSYIPGLIRSVLIELGVSGKLYIPLAIYILASLFLVGAWLGVCTVRKMVLRKDGTIDPNTSLFVSWTLRFVAVRMLLQSSSDQLLVAGSIAVHLVPFIVRKIALMIRIILSFMRIIYISFGTMVYCIRRTPATIVGGVSTLVQELFRWYRKLLKSPQKKKKKKKKKSRRRSKIADSLYSECAPDYAINKFQCHEDYKFLRTRTTKEMDPLQIILSSGSLWINISLHLALFNFLCKTRPGGMQKRKESGGDLIPSRNNTWASFISSGLGSIRATSPVEKLCPSYCFHTTPERIAAAVSGHKSEIFMRHSTSGSIGISTMFCRYHIPTRFSLVDNYLYQYQLSDSIFRPRWYGWK